MSEYKKYKTVPPPPLNTTPLIQHAILVDSLKRAFKHRDVEPHTVRQYKHRLNEFFHFCTHGVYQDTFIEYKAALKKLDISASYQAEHLNAARQLIRDLVREGTLSHDISAGVKGIKRKVQLKGETFTDLEINKMFKYLTSKCSTGENRFTFLRVRAMVALECFHGFRGEEVHRLKTKHVDLEGKVIEVSGKGTDDKECMVLSDVVSSYLSAYIEEYQPPLDGHFFYRRDLQDRPQPISVNTIRERIIKYAILAPGLPKNKRPHGFRRFHANMLLGGGCNIEQIRKGMRHATIKTTQGYLDQSALADHGRNINAMAITILSEDKQEQSAIKTATITGDENK